MSNTSGVFPVEANGNVSIYATNAVGDSSITGLLTSTPYSFSFFYLYDLIMVSCPPPVVIKTC